MGDLTLTVNTVYRYPRPAASELSHVDGMPNFYWHMAMDGYPSLQLERGIGAPASGARGRRPAILIRSSPNKHNSADAPWEDAWERGTGVLRYFGDNRSSSSLAWDADGNLILLDEHRLHRSPERMDRLRASPLLVFTGVTVGDRPKGNVRFEGVFVLGRVELLWQIGPDRDGRDVRFQNLAFSLHPVATDPRDRKLDLRWIEARRSRTESDEACLELAPERWQRWVEVGDEAL